MMLATQSAMFQVNGIKVGVTHLVLKKFRYFINTRIQAALNQNDKIRLCYCSFHFMKSNSHYSLVMYTETMIHRIEIE